MTTTISATNQVVLPGQAAAPAGPVDMVAMFVMHHAFRRDLAAFGRAVAATPVADRATWTALAARWARFFDILHKHHSGEDAGLWPLLLERADAAGDAAGRATLEAMEAEHSHIDPLLESCGAGFDRLAARADADARDALEVRLAGLVGLLDQHLAHEESDALTLVQRYLSDAEWRHLEETHFKPKFAPKDLPFLVSWATDGVPADVRKRMMPAPLVWLLRGPLGGGYRRAERAAFRHA